MSLSFALIQEVAPKSPLFDEWRALAKQSDGAFFRGPCWAMAWFRAYKKVTQAELCVVCARDGERLVGLAPLYTREVRVAPGVTARELRMLGDAGPRPPSFDLLSAKNEGQKFARDLAVWLTGADAPVWDVIDLEPLCDPSPARAYFAQRLDGAGHKVTSHEAGTTLALTLASQLVSAKDLEASEDGIQVFTGAAMAKGLVALRRLSRTEWAIRDEASPIADAEATQLLDELIDGLAKETVARLATVAGDDGQVIAAALIVDDGPRASCIALAVDPHHEGARRLLTFEARAAAERGLLTMDVVLGCADLDSPALPWVHRRSLRLRVFNSTTAGQVARTRASIRRSADAARDAPGVAAATARGAWSRIRAAASSVAAYQRFHLYRGELWTRGIKAPEGLDVSEFSLADFDALDEIELADLVTRLELDEAYCREKWARGDLVVLARLAGHPAGIAWCARSAVFVPEIGRDACPGPSECYIHDVLVASSARGKNVAPVMLESLARLLRSRDVYRAWALIEPSNVASIRAFQKAAYASVADVIYARMAVVDKLVLRPPDKDGKQLLGIQ